MKYNELHKKLKKCGCYPTGKSIAGSGNIKKHNPNFKVVEFDHFRMQAGLPNFVLSVSEWLEKTNAVGLIVKKGRYGGTYAHKDIAFEFGSANIF